MISFVGLASYISSIPINGLKWFDWVYKAYIGKYIHVFTSCRDLLHVTVPTLAYLPHCATLGKQPLPTPPKYRKSFAASYFKRHHATFTLSTSNGSWPLKQQKNYPPCLLPMRKLFPTGPAQMRPSGSHSSNQHQNFPSHTL